MNVILTAVVIVAVIGLVLGILLSVASVVMAVPVDEKAVAIQDVLAGANCGACGYSGCSGYAAALSEGSCTDTTLCSPGGADCARAIAEILGVSAGEVKPMTAVVLCHGTAENCGTTMEYHGDMSCKTASQLYAGGKACSYGCLGLGDCVKACPYGSIHIGEGGVAEVNAETCRACKLCISTCPKGIIELVPLFHQEAVVYCRNQEKGAFTRKECKVGCIGCMKCKKTCPHDAISITNFVAHVDQSKCVGCGDCVAGCPTHCLELSTFGKIIIKDGTATVAS
ncbi:MAG: RnfABCDGE type electron transport complex subunit B [Clostridia bacterium]|nr:RnfABCDGE type electron transport complex subunit B [Clostridia bacterium]